MIQLADSIAKEIYKFLFPLSDDSRSVIQVRPFNLGEVHTIRNLSPSTISSLCAGWSRARRP
jgi:DNA replicative helicase MCM subunit Mcm2 (Cdc46/Mcm family)